MKCQKGQALIMVLLFLGVGTLLIVPALQFTITGLRSQRISEDTMNDMSKADSALQDTLWQLLNIYMGGFDPSNPEIAYEFQYGAARLPVTIKIPTVPPSQDYGTGEVHHLIVDVEPKWVETPPGGGSYTFNYIVRFDTQKWTLTSFRFTLPQGLTHTPAPSTAYYKGPDSNANLAYDAQLDLPNHRVKIKNGSWVNMSASNYVAVTQWPPPGGALPGVSYLLVTTDLDGRQTLEWRPYFGSPTGRRIFIQTIQVSGNPPWGVNYLAPVTFNGGFGNINIDQTAAMGVAMYTVLMDVGGITYQVVLAYDTTTGKFQIISYQIME